LRRRDTQSRQDSQLYRVVVDKFSSRHFALPPSAKFSLDGDSLADLPMGLGRHALFAVCRLVIRWTTPRCHLRPFSFPRLLPREREGGEPDRSIDKACERA